LEEHAASIFRVEDRCGRFLSDVDQFLPGYVTVYLGSQMIMEVLL
jgi:hypothetical protein